MCGGGFCDSPILPLLCGVVAIVVWGCCCGGVAIVVSVWRGEAYSWPKGVGFCDSLQNFRIHGTDVIIFKPCVEPYKMGVRARPDPTPPLPLGTIRVGSPKGVNGVS